MECQTLWSCIFFRLIHCHQSLWFLRNIPPFLFSQRSVSLLPHFLALMFSMCINQHHKPNHTAHLKLPTLFMYCTNRSHISTEYLSLKLVQYRRYASLFFFCHELRYLSYITFVGREKAQKEKI